jgi:hypothetical protein
MSNKLLIAVFTRAGVAVPPLFFRPPLYFRVRLVQCSTDTLNSYGTVIPSICNFVWHRGFSKIGGLFFPRPPTQPDAQYVNVPSTCVFPGCRFIAKSLSRGRFLITRARVLSSLQAAVTLADSEKHKGMVRCSTNRGHFSHR